MTYTYAFDKSIIEIVTKKHPIIADIMAEEDARQNNNIELIASENFASEAVRAATASAFINKYSEGYPDYERTGQRGRYYGGCEVADKLEQYCCDKWKEAFNTDYHCNVQPHSGSQANYAVYSALLKEGNTVLAMSLDAGGHLTHSSPVSTVSKRYKVATYGLDQNGLLDYKCIYEKIKELKPTLIVSGASAYSRIIDFARIKSIIEQAKNDIEDSDYAPLLMADISHIAGLVISRDHPSPFGYADVVTTTTHKTLRGNRGALIFCKPELAKRIDSGVFPQTQGGSLLNMICGKAVTAEEDCTEEYKQYIHQVVRNAKAMCEQFKKLGYDIVTDGTDNHLFMLDLSRTHPNLTGKQVQDELDRHCITANKNCVPNEKRSPKETSGIRIGTPAMTTKGLKEQDFINIANKINGIILNMK